MKFLVKIVLVVADLIGINGLFRFLTKRRVRILMYHGVTEQMPEVEYRTVISISEFEWQMRYVKRHYQVVPPESLLGSHSNQVNRVVLTFDDGLLNTYTGAWPILKELGFKAIVFVLPGLMEKDDIIWADHLFQLLIPAARGSIDLSRWDLGIFDLNQSVEDKTHSVNRLINKLKSLPHGLRIEVIRKIESTLGDVPVELEPFELMTLEQLRELAAGEEFVVGGHTLNHPILATMNRQKQEEEIRGCFDKLADWHIETIPIFAFPNGRPQDYNEESVAILKECGQRVALTTTDGHYRLTEDPFHIPRVLIGDNTSRWEFKARLSGFYYWLKSLA